MRYMGEVIFSLQIIINMTVSGFQKFVSSSLRGSREQAANSALSRPSVTVNGILEYALNFVAVTNKLMSLGTS